jgi:hypothetical protein
MAPVQTAAPAQTTAPAADTLLLPHFRRAAADAEPVTGTDLLWDGVKTLGATTEAGLGIMLLDPEPISKTILAVALIGVAATEAVINAFEFGKDLGQFTSAPVPSIDTTTTPTGATTVDPSGNLGVNNPSVDTAPGTDISVPVDAGASGGDDGQGADGGVDGGGQGADNGGQSVDPGDPVQSVDPGQSQRV